MAPVFPSPRRRFSKGARLLERAFVRLVLSLLKRVPVRTAARIKEGLMPSELLDYPSSQIRMSSDSFAAWTRSRACAKEPETVAWLESVLRPGDVFYDIGANVGAYSLIACGAAPACRAYAFEPGFASFAALCTNVALNDLGGRVFPLNLALAEETRLGTFHYSDIAPGAALHRLIDCLDCEDGASDPPPAAPASFRQSVVCYRLDQAVGELGLEPPNHIKLDVDGAELAVLRGAGQLLGHRDLVSLLVEVDDADAAACQVLGLLEQRGFRVRSRHPRTSGGRLANIVFERARQIVEGGHAA